MDKSKQLPPELQGAFSIFVQELSNHVVFLAEIVGQLQMLGQVEIEPISDSRAQQLQNRFHRIKGGAGFLGLSDISELASKGESLFKKSSGKELKPSELSRELSSILSSLEQASRSL